MKGSFAKHNFDTHSKVQTGSPIKKDFCISDKQIWWWQLSIWSRRGCEENGLSWPLYGKTIGPKHASIKNLCTKTYSRIWNMQLLSIKRIHYFHLHNKAFINPFSMKPVPIFLYMATRQIWFCNLWQSTWIFAMLCDVVFNLTFSKLLLTSKMHLDR